jgi:hypothetical protein
MTAPDFSNLPQWAVDLLAARDVRRLAQVYRKAHSRPPGLDLFERLAAEFERPEPRLAAIRSMHAEFESTYQSMQTPETRAPAVTAAAVCKSAPAERCFSSWFDIDSGCTGLDKRALAADRKLYDRTRSRDAKTVRAAPDRASGLRALGTLWPLGEPRWLNSHWKTYREQKARVRSMWNEDEAPDPARAATSPHPSTRLPESILEALTPTRWDLTYRAAHEVRPPIEQKGSWSAQIQQPKRHARRFTIPARHGFREPAPAVQRAALASLASSTPSLRFLFVFYREHDGALLFRARGAKPLDSHVRIHGLADQPRALKQLVYHLDQRKLDSPDRILRRWGCDRESVIVIATAGISLFFIPLKGSHAGKVIRVFILVEREEMWARSFVDGLVKFRTRLITLAARHELPFKMGDESKGGFTLLTLAKALPADRQPS